jgi:DNA-binding transcriptional ArsR family regulator
MKTETDTQRRLACLGDASRYRLVTALASGPRCVSDLAEAVGLSQSCTTRHLQALQAAGLVGRTRDGKRVMVRLNRDEPGAGPMLDWVLEQLKSGAAGIGARGRANGGRLAGPKRSARLGQMKEAAEPASGVGNGKEPRKPRRPVTHPAEEVPAVELEPVRQSDTTPSRASVSRPAEAASEVDREEVQQPTGLIRRPDTIEDYLL